jgi:hypothetical protein
MLGLFDHRLVHPSCHKNPDFTVEKAKKWWKVVESGRKLHTFA